MTEMAEGPLTAKDVRIISCWVMKHVTAAAGTRKLAFAGVLATATSVNCLGALRHVSPGPDPLSYAGRNCGHLCIIITLPPMRV